jgi:hypothetical protein
MNKISKKKVIETIEKTKGLVSVAAKHLGVTRKTLYNYIHADEDILNALDDAREGIVDMAEGKLMEQVTNGDTTAIIFTLKTLGKKRGYIEKQEIDHSIKEMPQLPSINLIIKSNEENNPNP